MRIYNSLGTWYPSSGLSPIASYSYQVWFSSICVVCLHIRVTYVWYMSIPTYVVPYTTVSKSLASQRLKIFFVLPISYHIYARNTHIRLSKLVLKSPRSFMQIRIPAIHNYIGTRIYTVLVLGR